MALILRSLTSAVMMTVALSAADAPPFAEQQRILDNVRQYADGYMENLPNFVCARVTEQFESGRKADRWKQRETLTFRLAFLEGREKQTLEQVNGKAVSGGRFVARKLETEGEFGILMSNVLNGNTDAQISWSRWEELNGHRLAVFEYVIDKGHSTLTLGLGVSSREVVPYRGLIYADPTSGEIRRITNTPFDIPESVATKSLSTTIDYDSVDIANRHFVLPVTASVWLDTGHNNVLNKIAFREYRKFETESKITFVGSN